MTRACQIGAQERVPVLERECFSRSKHGHALAAQGHQDQEQAAAGAMHVAPPLVWIYSGHARTTHVALHKTRGGDEVMQKTAPRRPLGKIRIKPNLDYKLSSALLSDFSHEVCLKRGNMGYIPVKLVLFRHPFCSPRVAHQSKPCHRNLKHKTAG